MTDAVCDAEQLCPHGKPPDRVCHECPDPCVVDSGPISIVIASYVEKWRGERPSAKGRYEPETCPHGRDPGDPCERCDGKIAALDVPLEPVAPYAYLAVETGLAASYAVTDGRFWKDARGRAVGVVNADDVARAERDIRKARNTAKNDDGSLRYPYVELRVADALIATIGEPSMFDDLTIRPNPKAPASRHGECCGGSLTGSGS